MTIGCQTAALANTTQNGMLSSAPADFGRAFDLIKARSRELGLTFPPAQGASAEISADQVTFSNRTPLNTEAKHDKGGPGFMGNRDFEFFHVDTVFFRKSPTIEKRVKIMQGRDGARLRYKLENAGPALEQTVEQVSGVNVQLYNRPQEMFMYFQAADGEGVDTKEWIYARRPNTITGSIYDWVLTTEEFKRRLVLAYNEKDGTIALQRQLIVDGIDPHDYAKQRRAVKAVKAAFKKGVKFHIVGEDIVGQIPPVVYWTKEGIRKKADLVITNRSHLSIQIHEPPESYPLLIDP